MKILWIGNSYTERNSMTDIIAELAQALPQPQTLQNERVLVGGATLRQHWNKGEAVEMIRRGGWNGIVLQEQSILPIKNAKRFHENVRLFTEEIDKIEAKPLLYLTWARQETPETQTKLNEAYFAIAKEINATVAPVGLAWQSIRENHPEIELFDPDGSHPTAAGSYLAACVFFTTFFQQSSVGITAPQRLQIPPATANILAQAAYKFIKIGLTH